YDNVAQFYDDVFEVLLTHEAQNTLILGNLVTGYKGEDKFGWRDPANWVMTTIKQDEEVVLVGLMTPPFKITLYALDNNVDKTAIKCLVDGLNAHGIPVSGVVTEKFLAEAFADEYCTPKDLAHKVTMSQRIYKLTNVNSEIPKIGTLRLPDKRDLSFLPFWVEDFMVDVDAGNNGTVSEDIEKYDYHISQDKLYILEVDGIAVSMTKVTRETSNGICIGLVYTPPYWRGKGYASGVVAQVSQACLDKGFKFCVLYTDLTNPTSNNIYQKIGYKPVCDSLEITFE
ncbi:MAG: GNAT family N-acetyltransferase, partial [Defluviitaleaceae bacterium]|nr:GNAT family N-acetyltransferase [Defluviitaleaceae bacterium]